MITKVLAFKTPSNLTKDGKKNFLKEHRKAVDSSLKIVSSNNDLKRCFVAGLFRPDNSMFVLDFDNNEELDDLTVKNAMRRLSSLAFLIQESTSSKAGKIKFHALVKLNRVLSKYEFDYVQSKVIYTLQKFTGLTFDILGKNQLFFSSNNKLIENDEAILNVNKIHEQFANQVLKAIKFYEANKSEFLGISRKQAILSFVKGTLTNSKPAQQNDYELINFEKLLSFYKKQGFEDYDRRFKLALMVRVMLDKKLIDEDQSVVLDEALVGNHHQSLSFYEKITLNNSPRSIGLNYLVKLLRENKVSNVFKKVNPIDGLPANLIDKSLKFDGKYIDEKVKDSLINWNNQNSGKKLLFVAPTGSGKTTFLASSNQLPGRIILTPRKAIAESIKGVKTVASTIDKAQQVVDHFIDNNKTASLILRKKADYLDSLIEGSKANVSLAEPAEKPLLIIDEAHLIASDATFRSRQANNLRKVEEYWLSLGLNVIETTATPDELNYKGFNEIYVAKRTQEIKKFSKGKVSYINDETELFKKVKNFVTFSKSEKLLLYVQNIDLIKRLEKLSNVKGVWSSKQGDDFNFRNCKVIATTTKIGTGISILNNADDETWVYLSKGSNLADYNDLVQIENRFRNEYKKFELIVNQSQAVNNEALSFEKLINQKENESREALDAIKKVRSNGELDELEKSACIRKSYDLRLVIDYDSLFAKVINLMKSYNLSRINGIVQKLEKYNNCKFEIQTSDETSGSQKAAKTVDTTTVRKDEYTPKEVVEVFLSSKGSLFKDLKDVVNLNGKMNNQSVKFASTLINDHLDKKFDQINYSSDLARLDSFNGNNKTTLVKVLKTIEIGAKFSSGKSLNSYLDKKIASVLGCKTKAISKAVLKHYLVIRNDRSAKRRSKTIVGQLNKETIKIKYNL
ncbi:DEAD/DEAH box helicase family protein [Lentilactobacillus kefiri]|uniref:DEAD/DEAH box helicase family protein n=6 Tax=Bacilli TaxID=91061 RepID=UPI000BA59A85|nr:DEAD/DEAH box helicase family protein [Lentilactobacillus kefiri]PAK82462.1 hypothetical protein B8W85_08145 [Lentilactobacillus kefiri]